MIRGASRRRGNHNPDELIAITIPSRGESLPTTLALQLTRERWIRKERKTKREREKERQRQRQTDTRTDTDRQRNRGKDEIERERLRQN